MYEYDLFAPPKRIMDWTDQHRQELLEYRPIAENEARLWGAELSRDVSLRYEVYPQDGSYVIEAIHAMANPWRDFQDEYNFKLRPAFRPKDASIWHTAIDFGDGRVPLVVALPRGGSEPTFSKIRAGGTFPMHVTGLVYQIACRNKQGTLRLYGGPTLEMRRRESHNPTLKYTDLSLSHLRSLNSIGDDEAPAFAEFNSVIEYVEKVEDREWPSYRLLFWSGQPASHTAFPVQAIVPKHILQTARYVPRVGDAVSGVIAIFGHFPDSGELEMKPANRFCQDEPLDLEPAETTTKLEATPDDEPSSDGEAQSGEEASTPGHELLPRALESYPEVEDFGGGLAKQVAKALPKYVLYRDYRRAMQGELCQLPSLTRAQLRAVLEQIPQLFKVRKLHTKQALLDNANLLHIARDLQTGERHVWIALAPVFLPPRVHTDLLVAIDEQLRVLRYTLLTEDDASDPQDFAMKGYHERTKRRVTLTSFNEVEDFIRSAKVGDFFSLNSTIYSTMFQSRLERSGWHIEWQHHYIHWQFKNRGNTAERLIELLHIYVEKGLLPLQTMARWTFVDVYTCLDS